jgi:hypothetical protein
MLGACNMCCQRLHRLCAWPTSDNTQCLRAHPHQHLHSRQHRHRCVLTCNAHALPAVWPGESPRPATCYMCYGLRTGPAADQQHHYPQSLLFVRGHHGASLVVAPCGGLVMVCGALCCNHAITRVLAGCSGVVSMRECPQILYLPLHCGGVWFNPTPA